MAQDRETDLLPQATFLFHKQTMFSSLGIEGARSHVVRMADQSNEERERRLLGLALKTLRTRAGMNQEDAADAFAPFHKGGRDEFSKQGWGLYETGKRMGIHKPDVQSNLARAVKSTREELLLEFSRLGGSFNSGPRLMPNPTPAAPPQPSARVVAVDTGMLPVRDRLQAGAWLQADDAAQTQPRFWPVARDTRYPVAQQWLAEVVGDSMNALQIFEGDLVHVVSAVDIGYHPRSGDVVEVERLRHEGSERELTIKQIEVSPAGVQLWPRSTNPRWREPLALVEEGDTEETTEVRIRGLCIGLTRRF